MYCNDILFKILKTYKKEIFDFGIKFIEIWKPASSHSTSCQIHIIIQEILTLLIYICDFVNVQRVDFKLKGEYVLDLAQVSSISITLISRSFLQ